jgi:tRNA (cytidine32/uridine32-2'-O)-methyltransferase
VLEAAAAGPVAVLFGRESSGLSNEELQRCHVHLLIPADPVYPSLNLAMAVQVVAYEIFRQSETRPVVVARWDRPRATVAEVEGLLDHFERALVDAAFLDPANPGQAMTRLRRMIERMEADATEVQLLRGVITALTRGSSASGQPE